MLSTPMTTLNNRLQLALLNRKRGKSALEKGFTLVELMIVIVIVGILSAVALPNFLSQTEKARATEAQSAISAAFKNAQQLYLENGNTSGITAGTNAGSCADGGNLGFNYTSNITAVTCALSSDALTITATTPDGTVAGTIDLSTGQVTSKPTFTAS